MVYIVKPWGKKFGKPWYYVVGTNIRSSNKIQLEKFAKLKSLEESIGKKMLKPNADIYKLSDDIEKIRKKLRRL